MCQQGAGCKRPLCFFAHNLQELRFSEGQLQQGSATSLQEPSAALAAASPQAGPVQGVPDIRQQQQQQAAAAAAAAAAAGSGQYVPYAVMPSGVGSASLPPLQRGFTPSPVAASPGLPHGGQLGMAAGQAMQQQQLQQQQLQQQQQGGMLQAYMTPHGYYLVGAGQAQAYPQGMFLPGGEVASSSQYQQQQQQQYLPSTSSHWQAAMGGPAGSLQLQMRPAAMQFNPALMGTQFQVVPADDQVLLGQGAGMAGDSSSHGLLAAQQQAQQDAAAGAVSGSQYSWNLNPGAGPSTTSASASMSLLSMPTMGLNSSASVPGSSNTSLNAHIRPGQTGTVSLDALQATMQHMSVRDCHVRDL
jgi:hypothetical protein